MKAKGGQLARQRVLSKNQFDSKSTAVKCSILKPRSHRNAAESKHNARIARHRIRC